MTLLLCFPASAVAQTVPGMQHVPKWHMVDNKACYDFHEAKALLQIDADISLLKTKDEINTEAIDLLKKSITAMTTALEIEQKSIKALKVDGEGLRMQLIAETTRANTAEAKVGSTPSMPWLIAGGAVLLVLGAAGGADVVMQVK